MRNRQDILGAIFGDLEKKFDRGVIDILSAPDRPEPETLVAAIREHTIRRIGHNGNGSDLNGVDALEIMIDALELCCYHNNSTTLCFALARAKSLRGQTQAAARELLESVELLPPTASQVTRPPQWRLRAD
ncbi:MAG TPA: hypothetical protein VM616_02860 [Gammaproteobacteria bacterium]|nr:hypothetical protein [Gammaproteobacteria bacterium]